MPLALILLGFILSECHCRKTEAYTPDWRQGPPALVYKTKHDYRNYVPVILSANRKEVVSYPHPSDLGKDDSSLPVKLAKGYLLDNRGITDHVAFLSLTYDDYKELKEIPTLDSLRKLVIDEDPLTALYYCGNKDYLPHPIPQLNGLILNKQLDSVCRRIK